MSTHYLRGIAQYSDQKYLDVKVIASSNSSISLKVIDILYLISDVRGIFSILMLSRFKQRQMLCCCHAGQNKERAVTEVIMSPG